MSRGAARPDRLTDGQVAEILDLARSADSVELKLTLPSTERRATVVALGIDVLDAQIRQVFFFDTPELALDEQGIVVRARRTQGRDDDTVVKLRPVVPEEVEQWRSSEVVSVEIDAMPGGYVCSASAKYAVKAPAVKEAVAGGRPLRKIFSKEQRDFFAAYAPSGVELGDLAILGPITVFKVKTSLDELPRPIVGELWWYPDGSQILELSAKCRPEETFQAAAELRAALASRGVDLDAEQQTKTRTALEYFAANLRSDSSG